jgi:S-adenosyl-L-methionine hydrolase (adenosine-forming)
LLPISFLSDYGHHDEWVGVCHGVIERIAAGATVIDIAHDLPPADVRHAAFVLENALPFLPDGIVMAVVDPRVGSERRGIALRCRSGNLLVGPDNGLLWPASQAAGGIESAVDVSATPFRLDPVSATFHGRDVFAPVAAHLALGAAPEDAGNPIDHRALVRLQAAAPAVDAETLRAEVRLVDRFGNVQLHARAQDMEKAGFPLGACVNVAGRFEATRGRTFADVAVGGLVVYEDSSGWIAAAVNGGSAAAALGVGAGSPLTRGPARSPGRGGVDQRPRA